MKDRCFIDTNVLIYCYSETEPVKKFKAFEISNLADATISTQVLNELANVLSKKFKLTWDEIENALEEVSGNYKILINHPESIKSACSIASKYRFSFYDSLIIASAIEAGCNILYSEDMQHNQLIETNLRIINPFLE